MSQEVRALSALFLGGVAVGATLGILFAPQAGADTREQLQDYAARTKDQANQVAQQVRSGLDRCITAGRAFVGQAPEAA